jgi:UDP-N-acetylglucosamine diphosphorylase / glucose-1-phosphate thymidylyltransferase / UDP-N-acetylgalactosamine diphosphorylase / glucosamine-1-phosphate N-acetyltransferase / galactosamine-1-phosphate N-acetyltransferase
MLRAIDFFDLDNNPFQGLFDDTDYVWEGLKNIKIYLKNYLKGNAGGIRRGHSFIDQTMILYQGEVITGGFIIDTTGKKAVVKIDGTVLEGASIIYAGSHLIDDDISIGSGTIIEPCAFIKGPTIIGDNTEVRHGAYIRGDVLVGDDCVVGHTTEIKSSIMFGGSKAGHFAYIGDSILGRVNLGAGTKLANLKMIDSKVVVNAAGKIYQTGLRKFGAILADGVETGCNSVTTPGALLGRNVLLYPNATARGYYPPGTVIKIKQNKEHAMLDQTER